VSVAALRSIDPAAYERHSLHRSERAWPESNCYVDVWLEIIHAIGLDPLACAGFALFVDFEADQWTFFKPLLAELTTLYGIEVQELTVWKPLLQHALEHIGRGRLVLTEADAFFLPDTSGTDYRRHHTKTTIAMQEIDLDAGRLGYFHNAGYFSLEGDDFAELFRLNGAAAAPAPLPLYAEFVRLERVHKLPEGELVARSLRLFTSHLERRPAENPVARFARRFQEDQAWLHENGLEQYHLYAFATLRQLGSAFEIGAEYLRWLERHGISGAAEAAPHCDVIARTSKALILKGARAVNAKRATDFSAMFGEMEVAWSEAMTGLVSRFAH
jgi:hypothetical protein